MAVQDVAKVSLKKSGKMTYDPVAYTAGFKAGWQEAISRCLDAIHEIDDKGK